jgi:hypothetical protein
MNKYIQAAAGPAALRTRPLRKLAKSVTSLKQANDKINAKTGNRSGNNPKTGAINSVHGKTYEERLSEFIELDEADFANILKKQHDAQAATKKQPVKDIPFHGWTIRYRPASAQGEKVSWLVLDRKHTEQHRGQSMSDKDAVADAEEWIKSGGGTRQEASSNVTIDFNVDFAREFAPSGETLYVRFAKKGNTPLILLSTESKDGFKRTHSRTQRDKMTATTTSLPMVGLSPKESNALGLQPNGRYLLGDKVAVDKDTVAFPLIFQSIVQGKGDVVKLGKPGLTVAHDREVKESCWDGYQQIGMKKKGKKSVPNCVPKESADQLSENPEYDDEAGMADNNLETLRRAVEGIDQVISVGDNLPEWCQEKIAIATADLVSVWDYMKSEEDRLTEVDGAPRDYMRGLDDKTLSELVKDTIRAHGVKEAFDIYVKQNGMPARDFKSFAGL